MLSVDVNMKLRDFRLDVSFSVSDGETLVLIGENGAGKSTILNIISGLLTPESGKIALGDDIYYSSEKKIFVPPDERSTGHLFQSYALFPHLSVFDNIAFGLRLKNVPKNEIEMLVNEQMETMMISEYSPVNVRNLSGGQRQRVALARALVLKPGILLLDEPLAAVDVRMQAEMRRELHHRIKAEHIPCIVVTHTLSDAIELGDKVAILEKGKIIQMGKPEEVFKKPASGFVAQFTGMENIFRGYAERTGPSEDTEIHVGDVVLHAITDITGDVIAGIRAEEILFSTGPVKSSARNILKGTVSEIHWNGPLSRVIVDAGIQFTGVMTHKSIEDLNLHTGQEIYVIFKAPAINVFPS
ncbi:molybdopterin-binding protein [Methanomicrobium sp. W14]|uniref:ABC transporter ATP-binding protein n=1 Tax=Methanomicrobium sp. W14 TaxID=2817839 RepID=UPI001AE87FB9|nr:ABC transporter ATP-binding protein [Methanomicrobium sp. W14]MBP2134153.1 molybdopterin-binding protein [Methanomicrobium sp. W14]